MAVSLLMTEVKYVEAATDELRALDDAEPQLDPEIAKQQSKQENNADSGQMPSSVISEHELVKVAKAGEVEEAIGYFSTLTQLNKDMTRHCLFEAHITALMVLCKANGMAQGTFTALLLLRENHTGEPTDDTVGLMRRYDGMTRETAQRIIRFSDKRQKINNEENGEASDSEEPQQALAS